MHVEGSASILALIELNHLTKTFKGKTQTVDALKDINLHIEQGDIFGIIGMSGAGKSTLVRCINFLEQPTSGSVVIDGKDLASLSPKALRQLRQQLGILPGNEGALINRIGQAHKRRVAHNILERTPRQPPLQQRLQLRGHRLPQARP